MCEAILKHLINVHGRALEFLIAELCEIDEVQQDKPIPEHVTTAARIAAVVGVDWRTHEFTIEEVCGQLPRPPEKAAAAVKVAVAAGTSGGKRSPPGHRELRREITAYQRQA